MRRLANIRGVWQCLIHWDPTIGRNTCACAYDNLLGQSYRVRYALQMTVVLPVDLDDSHSSDARKLQG